MRATRAYITGFGTTGLLIASAFMMLFVMSAFVAFNGFPGQDVQDPIGTLQLQERQAPVSVPAVPVKGSVREATRSPAAHHRQVTAERARGPQASTGPVKHRVPTQAPASTQAPATTTGAGTAPQTAPQLPATTPSVPTTDLPKVELPPVVQAPAQPQLPVDTSGITNLLGGQ